MLIAVPAITAFDDLFMDGTIEDPMFDTGYIDDPMFDTGYIEDPMFHTGYIEDPMFDNSAETNEYYTYETEKQDTEYYTYENSPDETEYYTYDTTEAEDDFLWDNPAEDPFYFDDPMDFPGDDIQDIGDDDIPPAPYQGDNGKDDYNPTLNTNGLSIKITGTRMPNEINQGEQLRLKIYIKNTGKTLDNLKIVLVNQEIAVRHAVGPMDLKSGEKTSRTLLLDFPSKITPGYYYLRINAHANGIDRVIYRDIYVK